MQLNAFLVRPFVEQGLREEIGPGDTTGGFLAGNDLVTEALVYAKQHGVVCGLLLAEETVRLLEPEAKVVYEAQDGDEIEPGDVLLRITAKASTLFSVERAALDWVQYLSGIATKARRYAKLVEPHGVRVTDTRKGVPGMRVLEKYAVRVGGAHNHLFGLHNAILVKDNHIKLAGGIKPAVEQLRAKALHTFKIEVECETLEEVEEALAAEADIIMFDNMDLDMIRQGLNLVDGQTMTEASGGIREHTIVQVAETGVDIISAGDMTHSAGVIDMSMDFGDIKPSAQRQIDRSRVGEAADV
jgi:nicotinate-nucleotide pyrophosphorylase (carboxylating)